MAPSSSTGNVEIVDIQQKDANNALTKDIFRGLEGTQEKSLPTLLLYDTKGLRLFEDITYMDEYYLTNAEIEALKIHAAEIAERVPVGAQLIELGSGNLRKVQLLLDELERLEKKVEYLALDVSLAELNRTFGELPSETYSYVTCRGLWGSYDDGLNWLQAPINRQKPTWIVSMGSSVGNFSRSEAAQFLANFAALLGPSDSMLIGLDSCKDTEKVSRAYDDSEGITRQFYMNGLMHANDVLGYPAFKAEEWDTRSVFDKKEGCHKAYFVPQKDVAFNGFFLKKGEEILFEHSFKYSEPEYQELWDQSGLVQRGVFANSSGEYNLHLLSPSTLDLPTKSREYAAHPTPSLQDFDALWRLWDVVTLDMVPKSELLSKPIELRNPLIFYLGHIPTFLDIHLTRATGGVPTEPKAYVSIFERGIDPDVDNPDQCHDHSEIPTEYPPVEEILHFRDAVRKRARSLLNSNAVNTRIVSEALWIGFEHEVMHLETFLYMLLQFDKTLPPPRTAKPDFKAIATDSASKAVSNDWFEIPAQTIAVGLDDPNPKAIPTQTYAWDNEKPQRVVQVGSFSAKARPVTNGEYAEYLERNSIDTIPASWSAKEDVRDLSNGISVNGDGSQVNNRATRVFLHQYSVRTVFGAVPLEWALDWPVSASFEELEGYAKWMNCRIPSFHELESLYLHSLSLKPPPNDEMNGVSNGTLTEEEDAVNGHSPKPRGTDHQPVLSGEEPARPPVYVDLHDCNVGFKHWHPTPVTPNGNTLCGRGGMGGLWEWSSSPLAAHEGFQAMDLYPGYTADFFDSKHNIVLGGSWATHPRVAGRSSFVNWYQRNYPFAWAGARLVRDI